MWLLKLLSGGLVGQIGEQLNTAYKTKVNAQNDSDRIQADKDISSLEAKRDVLIAESQKAWNILFRGFLALPFAVYAWKVVVVDKVLRLGTTDPLGPDMMALMGLVFGFYFVDKWLGARK